MSLYRSTANTFGHTDFLCRNKHTKAGSEGLARTKSVILE
jgi:hypothetical protein